MNPLEGPLIYAGLTLLCKQQIRGACISGGHEAEDTHGKPALGSARHHRHLSISGFRLQTVVLFIGPSYF